jgi:hypothetical protein
VAREVIANAPVALVALVALRLAPADPPPHIQYIDCHLAIVPNADVNSRYSMPAYPWPISCSLLVETFNHRFIPHSFPRLCASILTDSN